jgi:hypothetical protein
VQRLREGGGVIFVADTPSEAPALIVSFMALVGCLVFSISSGIEIEELKKRVAKLEERVPKK